jgi:hypothetical protein
MDMKELNDTLKACRPTSRALATTSPSKAEAAMTEAKNSGTLSAETKAEVDKLIASQAGYRQAGDCHHAASGDGAALGPPGRWQ